MKNVPLWWGGIFITEEQNLNFQSTFEKSVLCTFAEKLPEIFEDDLDILKVIIFHISNFQLFLLNVLRKMVDWSLKCY